jgi:hypothetical protein
MLLCNVGPADRIARAIAGLAAIGAGIITESWWGAVGFIPLLSAAFRLCPVYKSLGLSTSKPDSDSNSA